MAEARTTQSTAAPTARRAAAARPRREREQELLVWPDLVFVEFISAVVFTFTLLVLSTLINAPLLDRANLNVTPNPSKAPWYFLNLQELLLHMHPALAGVIVPTVWLILLAAFPYFDQSREAQGVWFGTPNSVRITVFAAIFAALGTVGLILFDAGMIEPFTRWFPCMGGGGIFGLRAFQTQCTFSVLGYRWPEDFSKISLGPLSGDWNLLFREVSIPTFLIEWIIPTLIMVVLPIMQAVILWRMGWARTRRDHLIALFTGFMATYLVLTIIGTTFRGRGMELEAPWSVAGEAFKAAQGEVP